MFSMVKAWWGLGIYAVLLFMDNKKVENLSIKGQYKK